jgi:membrane-associated phospholipid phosphatase
MTLTHVVAPGSLTRRHLLTTGLGMGVGWLLAPQSTTAAPPPPAVPPLAWRPWLLPSRDAIRPAPPAPPSEAEVAELLALQRRRTVATLATVERWDDPSVILPWTNLALDLIKLHQPNPVRAGRALALLHVALFDTLAAVWDARAAYPRPSPATIDQSIVPLGRGALDAPAYPSEHAAVATVAATVLAYLFPGEDAATLFTLAEEVANSRLSAGRAFRGDVEAGQAIGGAVGQLAVARGEADGSSATWDGTGRLTGPGYWQPTPPGYFQQPVEPLAGHWQTWVLARGDQYRPPPPPPYGSPAWQAELIAVQEAAARRTAEQAAAAKFWAGGPGTVTPAGLWIEIARKLIVRDGLDGLPAARVLALTSVAMADGFICCWDAKYVYWEERPITADPSLVTVIPTPPFPGYTSGHATISPAAATVLGYLFPDDEAELAGMAVEAKNSRLWAGIHFPIDNEMGALGGGMIGRLVVARAQSEDAT